MISYVYQLIAPKVISVKFDDIHPTENDVLIKPTHLAICHADQRYFRGLRSKEVLDKKLPMALIHEAAGIVIEDKKGVFAPGDQVVMVPNVPGDGTTASRKIIREIQNFVQADSTALCRNIC